MSSQLRIRDGRFLVYRLYDIANEIDLSLAEQHVAAHMPITRLQLRRLRPKVVRFTVPPLSFAVPLSAPLSLSSRLPPVRQAFVRLYDFGVAGVRFEVPIPPNTPVDEIYGHLSEILEVDAGRYARPLVHDLMSTLDEALFKPQWDFREWEEEDYLILFVRALEGNGPVKAEDLLEHMDIPRLLMAEEYTLSPQVREDVLQYAYTYSTGDLAVISWETAFVYDSEGIMDVPDLLEFATAQLLELAFFDSRLDDALDAAYDEVELLQQAGRGVLRYRHIRRILNRLLRTIVEMTEISGRVINALRLTEDVFYARVYAGATEVFGVHTWMEGVQEKLDNLREIYTLLAEEAADTRMTLLEGTIVLLFLVDIILYFING